MKLKDLVTEEELNEFAPFIMPALGLAARAGMGLMRGAQVAPAVGRAVVPRVASATRTARMAQVQFGRSMLSKLGVSKNSWLGQQRIAQIQKSIQRKGLKAHNDAVTKNLAVANAAKDKVANLGLVLTNSLLLAEGFHDYLMARDALDPNSPTYQEDLNKLTGEFVMGFLAAKFIGTGLKLTGKGVTKLLSYTSASPKAREAVRLWSGILARIGEAGALAMFMNNDKAKAGLAHVFGGLLTDVGEIANKGAEMLISLFVVGAAVVKTAAKTATGAYDDEKWSPIDDKGWDAGHKIGPAKKDSSK
jgi:hypothetical protein